MDKTIFNTAEGKPLEVGDNPDAMDVPQLKSVLGQRLQDADLPDEEKARLRRSLHELSAREDLMDLWREITGH